MKKSLILVIALAFFASGSTAFAGTSGCGTGPDKDGKGGWQRMYNDMDDMFEGKSSTKHKSMRGRKMRKRIGTEVQPKTD